MTNKILLPIVSLTALICIAYPWFTIQGQYLVNGNISWLLMAAERLLAGQDLVQNIYETNPPLNILIYTPHVIFAKVSGLPLTIASFYVTSFLVILSSLGVYAIVRKFDQLNAFEKNTFILIHLIATTLATSVFFSDREHFIILGLIPFILCQYALTEKIKLNSILLWAVMTTGAICILVKPHYGLLPTIFLLHRAISHRTYKVVFHPDFMALAIATLSYITMILIIFPDFVTTILPDVLTLYAGRSQNVSEIINASRIHLILYLSLLLFEMFREDLPKEKKRLLIWLQLSCAMCMVPYYVQMKGFYNHLLPAYSFFILGLCLSFAFRITKTSKKAPIFAVIIPLCVAAGVIKIFSPLNTNFPKQNDIPNLPVATFLEEHCSKPCTFYAFHGDIEIFNPTAARMGYTHATRFPSLWFIPKIFKETDQHEQLKEKYTQFVAEDLNRYKPSVILLAKDLPVGTQIFHFMDFFGTHPDIKKLFEQHYKKTEDFEFDRSSYFKGTTLQASYIYKYDVYTLNP